jgi:8-amino-7-oxononanoate synthase
MRENKTIAEWLSRQTYHRGVTADRLPSPSFAIDGREQISFSTNNYLAIASDKRMIAAALKGLYKFGVGNCESRLLSGNLSIYNDLEDKLADAKGKPAAMLFATGYLTNLGVLSTIPHIARYARIYGFAGDVNDNYAYFGDEFNHISIREGIRLAGTPRYTFRHRDCAHLERLLTKSDASCKIIVTDGVFSQDGDIAPLPDLLAVAERHDAMIYIDDAHGTGVLGRTGGGICEHFGIDSERIIYMGTLSKAYGCIGGFIAGPSWLIDILRLACSAYGFTSTLPPDQAYAVSEAIDMVGDEPWRREALWDNQRYFVHAMSSLRYRLLSRETPIVPILIGGEAEADAITRVLRQQFIHVDPVKFPAVQPGRARIRVQLNAGHSKADINALVEALAREEAKVMAEV